MMTQWRVAANIRSILAGISLALLLTLVLGTGIRRPGPADAAEQSLPIHRTLTGITADAGSLVLSPDSAPFGKTYAQWAAAWWQWDLAIPAHSPPFSTHVNHPLVDPTGAQCGVGQSGPVWFLGGADFQNGQSTGAPIVRNSCTVPTSKALFFPLLNIECSTLEGSKNGCADTLADNQTLTKQVIDMAANVSADVDGAAVPVTLNSNYREHSAPFSFTLPQDDVLSFIGEGPFHQGIYSPAVDAGYYVMLAPLPAGQHKVHFHGEVPAFSYVLDVTYNLTVK
jgi:hypothetical protein